MRKDIETINQDIAKPSVFQDSNILKHKLKELKNLNYKLNTYNDIKCSYENVLDFMQLLQDSHDDDLAQTINDELSRLSKVCDELYINLLLSQQYDNSNAFIKIHSGAGGTESCDWVEMLFRMYKMYAEKNAFKLSVIDTVAGDGAGFKSITFELKGDNAYGYMKSESGVHRLVRISPFDSNKRRHTSFASVEVLPHIQDNNDIVIEDKDLKIDTYRSGGAGGQHVNTTDSAVRITHIPTGVVVTCQNQRSQLQNKEVALSVLKSKLITLKLQQAKDDINELKGEQKKIEWGSQIRSYVFTPYTMVKDHRTNCETSNVDMVMNGQIDDFIIQYLKMISI